MGFFWSSPTTACSLETPLLERDSEVNLRSGDLLLVSNPEFEISMDYNIWSHVALIFLRGSDFMVLHDGSVLSFESFIERHRTVFIRHVHCRRPSNFETSVCDAVNKTIHEVRKKDIDEKYREGFCVAYALALLKLASVEGLNGGELTPAHFSHDTPFKRLNLTQYSINYRLSF